MRKSVMVLSTLCLGGATALAAHDMFLKLQSYFLPENTAVVVPLLNGTFTTSENSIDRSRIADISLITPEGRTRFDTTRVTARGDSTFLRITTGGSGTSVLGVSTNPNRLKISGQEFTAYLEEEGLTEVIAARKEAGISADSASERYAKHVKAVVQVGNDRGDGYAAVLGYPAEIIPLENPYLQKPGGNLGVRALVRGVGVEGLILLVGGRTPGGARLPVQRLRTGPGGEATISIARRGLYYVKFISMVKQVAGETDYVSNWATMTFQVR
jgi:hypothetical protein